MYIRTYGSCTCMYMDSRLRARLQSWAMGCGPDSHISCPSLECSLLDGRTSYIYILTSQTIPHTHTAYFKTTSSTEAQEKIIVSTMEMKLNIQYMNLLPLYTVYLMETDNHTHWNTTIGYNYLHVHASCYTISVCISETSSIESVGDPPINVLCMQSYVECMLNVGNIYLYRMSTMFHSQLQYYWLYMAVYTTATASYKQWVWGQLLTRLLSHSQTHLFFTLNETSNERQCVWLALKRHFYGKLKLYSHTSTCTCIYIYSALWCRVTI